MNTKKYTQEELLEHRRDCSRRYYEKNKERINAYQKEYRKSKQAEKPPKIKKIDSPTYKIISVDGKTTTLHRHIWIINNGEIPKNYIIHHINGDITDNRLENLQCISRSEHAKMHKENKLQSNGNYYTIANKKWKEENKEHWNEYQAKYKRDNKEKYYQYNRDVQKKYYENNKEKISNYQLNYYNNHRDEILERRRLKYQLKTEGQIKKKPGRPRKIKQ